MSGLSEHIFCSKAYSSETEKKAIEFKGLKITALTIIFSDTPFM